MQNGFEGIVSGLFTIPNCVMTECKHDTQYCDGGEIMQSLVCGKAFRVVSEDGFDAVNDHAVCRCHVVRLFGIGMVGGGVFCKVMKVLGEAGIGFYGASLSECGIAIALPRDRLAETVRLISAELLEEDRT